MAWDVAFSPDGRWLVTESSGRVELWDVEMWRKKSSIRSRGQAQVIAFSPDGRLIGWGADDRIFAWDYARRRIRKFDNRFSMGAFAFSPDGRLMASPTVGREINLFNLEDKRPSGHLKCSKD